jgi:hypothetical protein
LCFASTVTEKQLLRGMIRVYAPSYFLRLEAWHFLSRFTIALPSRLETNITRSLSNIYIERNMRKSRQENKKCEKTIIHVPGSREDHKRRIIPINWQFRREKQCIAAPTNYYHLVLCSFASSGNEKQSLPGTLLSASSPRRLEGHF